MEKKPVTKQPGIFDRLTDSSKYTGAHKERFNQDGTGKGIVGRVDGGGPKDLSSMVNSKATVTTTTKTTITKKPIYDTEEITETVKKVTETTKPKAKQPGIFDRLTDSSKYTGAHKERFNQDGTGKGISGREDGGGPKNLSSMVKKK